MRRNDTEVVAEVRAAFLAYEEALVSGDLTTMADYFDDASDLVRFGIGDEERGPEELAAWRAAQGPHRVGRTLRDTVVATFGSDVGIVSTAFSYPDRPWRGRQSQVWLRREGEWKIVHAHVSEIADLDVARGV